MQNPTLKKDIYAEYCLLMKESGSRWSYFQRREKSLKTISKNFDLRLSKVTKIVEEQEEINRTPRQKLLYGIIDTIDYIITLKTIL